MTEPPARRASARALANVALVKYFGKRDQRLNLPAAGSLSIALEPLETITTVELDPALEADEVRVATEPADAAFAGRVSRFLDLVRELAGIRDAARVETRNSFPTAAGLASSASGFAALAAAAGSAAGLGLDPLALSALARRGSGSAARSVPGGIAVWKAGREADGSDSVARRIAGPYDWDLRIAVGVCSRSPKPIGSSEAMELTRRTSPYYAAWIESARRDLDEAIAAVESRDLEQLGDITERSALAMHAVALAARPGIAMLGASALEALRAVRELRRSGVAVWFTCDAGPQPKVLCSAESEDLAVELLAAIHGVDEVIRCRPGGGVELLEDDGRGE